jgi:hypothetical protein
MKDIAASLLNFSVSFLPYMALLLFGLLIATVVTYFMYRMDADGTRRSLFRFLLRGVLVAFVAGFVGTGLGIAFFCSHALGNLRPGRRVSYRAACPYRSSGRLSRPLGAAKQHSCKNLRMDDHFVNFDGVDGPASRLAARSAKAL